MSNNIYSFEIDKGTDWNIFCEYYEGCTPIDITAGSFAGKIREGSYSGSVVANFTINKTEPLNGKFELVLSASTTTAFTAGASLYYDVELTLGGKVKRLIEGIITVRGEVTYG